MRRDHEIARQNLLAFHAVARERSFTRAAAKVGVSQSALTRTTRSAAPTEAGERLLRTAGPHFDEIDAQLAALTELREKPAGTVRITAGEHAAEAVLWPALARLLPDYPDINIEVMVNNGLTDIVAGHYDAGMGLAYLPEDTVRTELACNRLVHVLDDWCPPFAGYLLYYPRRRQLAPAFVVLVNALRCHASHAWLSK